MECRAHTTRDPVAQLCDRQRKFNHKNSCRHTLNLRNLKRSIYLVTERPISNDRYSGAKWVGYNLSKNRSFFARLENSPPHLPIF